MALSATQHEISAAEKRFLEDGIKQGFRNDGRSCVDYRPLIVESGVIPSASGSARVRSAQTDVLCGVKCEMSKPEPGHEFEGMFKIEVECSPSVSPDYEGREGEDFSTTLASLLEKMCAPSWLVDRRSLCVLPHHYCWCVYVDVMVLNSGGNLLDTISVAIRAALKDTIIPSVEVVVGDDEEGGPPQLEVDDRPTTGRRFPVEKFPVCVTVGQICNRYVWDMSLEEEACCEAALLVAVDPQGKCVGVHKTGDTTIDAAAVPQVMQQSSRAGVGLIQKLDELLDTKMQAGKVAVANRLGFMAE
eukprot:GDKI01032574.1.p1 GENE.GDKI01032574.1~~GDKI01032574.1.p1  ORF type:complete len:302 (-),score=92.00 GDKI01032574.1:69-974(-)